MEKRITTKSGLSLGGYYVLASLLVVIFSSFKATEGRKDTYPIPGKGSLSQYSDCSGLPFKEIKPSDLGLSCGIPHGTLSIDSVDVSTKWGLPQGSILVSVCDVSTDDQNDEFVVEHGKPITFRFHGSIPVIAQAVHASSILAQKW